MANEAAKIAEYTVDLNWDSEAAVWVATSENIPGLILESGLNHSF